jgi:DNA invertase Pin-like site-specific DNA recombinase
MERKITVTPAAQPLSKRTKVAAYARVSRGTEHMLHSLAAQVSYYSKYIQSCSDWEYAGVYADADETGTKDDRPEFQRLIADCRAGLVERVITKSISRFARNTVTLLETVRELKDLGIGVWFEEQNIDTLTGDGELMMTILAGFAQEESRSVSENIKWRKRNDMKNGKTKPIACYGYQVENETLVAISEQADVVRSIFAYCLDGLGQQSIANTLNERGLPSPKGKTWCSGVVRGILTNPKMCGDVVHQRKYVTDHISKKQVKNRGELPMYKIEDAHEGIVSKETFNAVQAELERRGKNGTVNESDGLAFRKKIVCGNCGRKFCHTSNGRGATKYRSWVCGGRDKRTGADCKMRQIPESTLIAVSADVLGLDEFDGDVFAERVKKIIAYDDRRLTFVFKDGTETTAEWQRRKPIPYSAIGIDKRAGRNICYSVIGKGNGKVGERRRKKLEEHRKEADSDEQTKG